MVVKGLIACVDGNVSFLVICKNAFLWIGTQA